MTKLTPKMIEWLTKLRDDGPQKRSRDGGIAYRCMQADLTEWDYRIDGEPATAERLEMERGNLWFESVDFNGMRDRITDLGRAALTTPEASS